MQTVCSTGLFSIVSVHLGNVKCLSIAAIQCIRIESMANDRDLQKCPLYRWCPLLRDFC